MRYLSLIALVPVMRYFILTTGGPVDRSNAAAGEPIERPNRRAFALGYSLGIAYFLTLLYWIANLIPASSARMPWLMIPATILLVLYLSCYTALFTLCQSFLLRRFGGAAIFAAPALWSLLEIARSRGELGFPWGILSNALVRFPVAVQGVSVYGPFGLSLVIVLVNLLVAFALFGRRWGGRAAAVVAAIVIIAGHLVWGAREIDRFDGGGRATENRAGHRRAAVIQPNTDLAIKWNPAYRDTIFGWIEEWTVRGGAAGVDIVVFPETAAPISFSHQTTYVRRLKRFARDNEVDLFTGFIDHTRVNDQWRPHNAAGLFNREGETAGYYIKVNLLPFGERMPFGQYIPFLGDLDFGQAEFVPGTVQTLFRSRAGTFGALICFESTFADYTRRYVLNGADFLVNITNDGWFGSTVGPRQHAETAVMRAVENRVTLLRAANTGISMVVDPVGRVIDRIDLDREGLLIAPIYPKGRLTFFCRHGHLAFWIMVLINLAAVGCAAACRRRTC
jgi:apolipoprotein N-acyltransferase